MAAKQDRARDPRVPRVSGNEFPSAGNSSGPPDDISVDRDGDARGDPWNR